MTRRVHITRKATLDIARSFTWMVENISVEAAEAWRNGLKEATRSLSTMALKCPEAPEAEWLRTDIRQLLYGRRKNLHRILFRVRDNKVEVLRVRHARQDSIGPDDL